MNEREALRYAFLSDWLDMSTTTKEMIIDKLIQNDERAKEIERLKNKIEDLEGKLNEGNGLQ